MKLLSILSSFLIASFAVAQNIDQTTRDFNGAPPSSVSSGKSSGTGGISASDTGAQRPISLIQNKFLHLLVLIPR